MDIKPTDLTIERLLKSAFYKIPRFQRPYSWDRDNVEEFWNGAIAADDPSYFIGSFVVHKSNSPYDPLSVVDGQQRLTTVTLLLASIRDALEDLGFKDLAAGTQQLIERPDINNIPQYVLQTETSFPYLQEHIQKHGSPELRADLGAEEEALRAAYEFLCSQILSTLRGVDADRTLSDARRLEAKKAKLLAVRDKVLRLQLILIELSNEDDAYLIFETLNTRGKDLGVSDLVKNHLTRLLRPTNKGVDTTREKWNGILELFDESREDIGINRFLHHWWLSKHTYITEKKLFKEVKRSVDKATARGFLDELWKDARTYRTLFEPDWRRWRKDEHELVSAIRALNMLRVVQPAPMLLAILREYSEGQLTLRQTATVLRAMENFHIQFTGVTAQRTGGGTAKMYALAARELSEANGKDAKGQILKEFRGKLRKRVPSLAEFEAGFAELRYTNEATKQRPIVRYILERVDAFLRGGVPVDYSRMSIEHLAAQRPAHLRPVSVARVGMMGNLVLIPDKLNTKLDNRPFEEKKPLMKKADVPMDEILEQAAHWSDQEIGGRTEALARLCFESVFTV